MISTQASLLGRLQQSVANNRSESWGRFVDIYTPLLYHWAERMRVPESDRSDLVQETLVKLLLSIATYQKGAQSGFRNWLFAVMRHAWIDLLRKRKTQPGLATEPGQIPCSDDIQQDSEDRDYRNYLLRRVHQVVVSDFPPISQQAFQRYVVEGQPAQQVAESLGITPNAVYLIRSRILRRVREELVGLVD